MRFPGSAARPKPGSLLPTPKTMALCPENSPELVSGFQLQSVRYSAWRWHREESPGRFPYVFASVTKGFGHVCEREEFIKVTSGWKPSPLWG
jgi:hypothetical protein